MACLECREEMPADAEEILQGEDEGVCVRPAHTATRILRDDGRVTGVEFLDVASFCFDEEGAPQIETVRRLRARGRGRHRDLRHRPGTGCARGFRRRHHRSRAGRPRHLHPLTSREGVFAAGDAVSGSGSVIKAIASGRKAAVAVDKYLGGSGRIDRKLAPALEPAPCLGRDEEFRGHGAAWRTRA